MTRAPEGLLLTSLRPIGTLLALLLFSSTCFAETDISVVWHDNHKLAPQAFEVMKRELQSIFADIGVEVSVRRGKAGHYKRFYPRNIPEINVILQPCYSDKWEISAYAMGAAIGAHAYIFFPRIQEALGLDGIQDFRRNLRATNVLGRALGRVVAHELFHTIVPKYPHRAEGLMCASLSRQELTRRRLYLDPTSAVEFVKRLDGKTGYGTVASSLSAEGADVPAALVSAEAKNPANKQ